MRDKGLDPSISGTSTLLSSTLLGSADDDPMSSMGNLMDVMLVFACGLMLALIMSGSIDMEGIEAISQDASLVEVDGELAEVQQAISENDSSYESLGTVYRDAETGKLYVVAP